MEEKIIEIIDKHTYAYWDNDSKTESPKVSEEENEAIKKCDRAIAKDIIQLFKK